MKKNAMKYEEDIIKTDANIECVSNEKFMNAYNSAKLIDNKRLLGTSYDIRWRIHTLLWAASHCENIEGDFVDCGCGFGLIASSILEYTKTKKRYIAIDSFEGLDENVSTDVEKDRNKVVYRNQNNWYETFLKDFKKYDNIEIYKGFVPSILDEIKFNKISFLSMDLNSASAEKSAMEFFWDKITSGAIIIIDDYAFPSHEGQKKVHDEFATSKGLMIMTSPTGQGILIKQ